jgi:hypothetical protein
VSYLPPTRELRERLDTAQTLTRFFDRERAVALACGGWIPRVPRLESKAELGRTAWESSLAADALRERCEQLVQDRVARATPEELERIRTCADALVEAAGGAVSRNLVVAPDPYPDRRGRV